MQDCAERVEVVAVQQDPVLEIVFHVFQHRPIVNAVIE